MEDTTDAHPPVQPYGVIIADNDPDVRAGLRLLLARQRHFRVVGECTSADELYRDAAAVGPDLILLDLELRGLRVMEHLGQLREACPRTAIIALSTRGEQRPVAVGAGASAFLCKNESPALLMPMLDAVARQLRTLPGEQPA